MPQPQASGRMQLVPGATPCEKGGGLPAAADVRAPAPPPPTPPPPPQRPCPPPSPLTPPPPPTPARPFARPPAANGANEAVSGLASGPHDAGGRAPSSSGRAGGSAGKQPAPHCLAAP
jgi:hypothetical protein